MVVRYRKIVLLFQLTLMNTLLPKKSIGTLTLLFLLIAPFTSHSQSSTLDGKYQEMMEKSETYEVYKVIKLDRLNTFWVEVQDSLNAQNRQIIRLSTTIDTLQSTVRSLNDNVERLTADLDESNSINDSISFLGIDFSKGFYHVLVWGIIGGCIVGLVIVFGMYKRSNSVTSRSLKDYRNLEGEYESHKNQSREKYVKLKRELQTALNKLEEIRKTKTSRATVEK